MEAPLKRTRGLIPRLVQQSTSISRVLSPNVSAFPIFNFLTRTELCCAMFVKKAWYALAIQPGLTAWSYFANEDRDLDETYHRLKINRFSKLRHICWSANECVDWGLIPLVPRSVVRVCVIRGEGEATDIEKDKYKGSTPWMKSLVQALPAVRELRLDGFFFCKMDACLQVTSLHTICLRECKVTNQTLAVIAMHSADTLKRLVLINTWSGGSYGNKGVRIILESCHRLKQLELGSSITHEVWKSAGVVCRGLEALCLRKFHRGDASLASIVTLFPNLQEVAFDDLHGDLDRMFSFPSILALARMPQLRRLDLGGLCLSPSNIEALAPALGRIESFRARIHRKSYKTLFRRLCPSPHLGNLDLCLPTYLRIPNEEPLTRNWLANEPWEMQNPYYHHL